MLKKVKFGGYLTIFAAILGVMGVVLTIISSSISADNRLAHLPIIAAAGLAGVVLCILTVWAPTHFGNYDIVGTVSIWGAIALYCYTFASALGQRVMLIAALFTFNSGNVLGWSIFYASVGAWGCLLVGCVVLILSSFLRTVKES